MKKNVGIFLLCCILTTVTIPEFFLLANPPQQSDGKYYFITLKDFTKDEVKGLGFTLDKDTKIHINAVGGGTKNSWHEWWGKKGQSNDMFASGWIINADTRTVVWEMTIKNTSGNEEERKCEDEIQLGKGSYEVYFSAYGYSSSSGMNFYSINIDRRQGKKSAHRFVDKFLEWFSGDDNNRYAEFMDKAKDVWGIYLSAPKNEERSIQLFNVPKKQSNVIFSATGVGDGTYIRKNISVNRDVTVTIYALGEGREKDEVFDYGWISDVTTRDRVWEMNYTNTDFAGGSAKNIRFKGEVKLPKGNYELNYVTDDSHSREDWNAAPPYDPFNYGITLSVNNENDKGAVSISEYNNDKKNIIVQLVKPRDDDFLEGGFSLKEETKLHIYAIGEGSHNNDELADYGWIINVKTGETVWEMKYRNTVHAGGASKNRLADEFITLPKGDYMVYYQTDDSHSYNNWNDSKPYDAESYGITVMGASDTFSAKSFSRYNESETENVIAQLVKVRDDRHVHQRFSLPKQMKVRVYAIGEGTRDEMVDYAWIENAATGAVVWEMTYRMTTRAGGAEKNRLFAGYVLLDKGEYEVHYQTDDSHAFGDWNDDPPRDRTHYGVTIYKE